MKKLFAILLIFSLLLSGCGGDTAVESHGADIPEKPAVEEAVAGTPDREYSGSELAVSVHNGEGAADSALVDGDDSTLRWMPGGATVYIRSDSPMESVYIRWNALPGEYELCREGGSQICGDEGYLHEYIVLDEPATELWFTVPEGENRVICDVRAFAGDDIPDDVQIWRAAEGCADILALPTRGGDETLYFGLVLAWYANGGLEVQLAFMSHHWNDIERVHELLDAVWALGLERYPIFGDKPWQNAASMGDAKIKYDTDDVTGWMVELLRRFKPMVVIGHDLKGEGGSYVNMLNAQCLTNAVDKANVASAYPESAQSYGLWNTPKLYLHLYESGQIAFPADEVMANGKTPLAVAKAAFENYSIRSAQNSLSGDSLFGLYRSLVGADSGNDMMENIEER